MLLSSIISVLFIFADSVVTKDLLKKVTGEFDVTSIIKLNARNLGIHYIIMGLTELNSITSKICIAAPHDHMSSYFCMFTILILNSYNWHIIVIVTKNRISCLKLEL
jgi:hypothetical protein